MNSPLFFLQLPSEGAPILLPVLSAPSPPSSSPKETPVLLQSQGHGFLKPQILLPTDFPRRRGTSTSTLISHTKVPKIKLTHPTGRLPFSWSPFSTRSSALIHPRKCQPHNLGLTLYYEQSTSLSFRRPGHSQHDPQQSQNKHHAPGRWHPNRYVLAQSEVECPGSLPLSTCPALTALHSLKDVTNPQSHSLPLAPAVFSLFLPPAPIFISLLCCLRLRGIYRIL